VKRGCFNSTCTFYKKEEYIISNGSYWRKGDSRKIQRFKCTYCGKNFSQATFSLSKWQKKRRVNILVQKLLSSGVSIRRSAIILKIDRKTVTRKLCYLALKAQMNHQAYLQKLQTAPIMEIQLDDLITIEHTKLKPLTVTVVVNSENRVILSAHVGRIPAFGHLADLSRKKYGLRPSEHKKSLTKVFKNIRPVVAQNATIKTDEHKLYSMFIRKNFPRATHQQYKSEPASIAGQGELKKVIFDPLFSINHTLAMLRANINRLFRRTWCTTKLPEKLQMHLNLFIDYYNRQLQKAY
jgi:hypothetical protein